MGSSGLTGGSRFVPISDQQQYGSKPLKWTQRHGHFKNLTGDIKHSDMRYYLKIMIGYKHFLNLTGDIRKNKR